MASYTSWRCTLISIGAAILLAITFTPVLASYLMAKSSDGKVAPGVLALLFTPVSNGKERANELLQSAHGHELPAHEEEQRWRRKDES